MKKIILVASILMPILFVENIARAEDTAAAPAVETSSAAVETSSGPQRGMTEPNKDIFMTLTRTPYPQDQLPTSADVVTPETFKKFDAQTAADAIARQTGIEFFPTGGQGTNRSVHIRGAGADQSLVLIDGRPKDGFALGTPDLSEVPVESIDHIEILRGGASSLYGSNAIGGVVNIVTKRATYSGQPVSDVSFEAGSFGQQAYRLNFGSRYGPLDYFFYGDQQMISGFRDNSDNRSDNIGGNLGVSMGTFGKIQVDASSYHSNAGIPGLACGPNDPSCSNFPTVVLMPSQFNNQDEKIASTPLSRQITDSNSLRAAYILPLPANTLMTARFFGLRREVEFNEPEFFFHTDTFKQSNGGELQYNLPLGLTVGGSFMHDRENTNDLITPTNTFTEWVETYGFFAQEEFHWEWLTLIPSGRFDHNSQFGDSTNPRVQTIIDATDWLRFSGSAGRSFRAPTLDEITPVPSVPAYLGGLNLRPEIAWTYDAGFELHSDSTSFRATYFLADVKDLIQTVSTDPSDFSAPFEAVNVGTARRQGAEIQLDHRMNEYFKDGWNYTYLSNVGTQPGSPDLVTLAFSPRHTVNYLATLTPFKKFDIDATARYLDSRWSGNGETGTKMGSQLIADLRASYMIRQLQLYVGINNINDKRYVEQPGFPLPGRTYYGGVTLKLWG